MRACAGVRGVLPGVADQVFEQHAQERRIARGEQLRLDLDLDRALRALAAQVVDDKAGDLRQVHRRARERLRRQTRELQQRVDHAVHARRRAEHALEVVVADRVEHRAVVFLDDLGEALDDADRRAQVVRDDVAERGVIGLVGALGGAHRRRVGEGRGKCVASGRARHVGDGPAPGDEQRGGGADRRGDGDAGGERKRECQRRHAARRRGRARLGAREAGGGGTRKATPSMARIVEAARRVARAGGRRRCSPTPCVRRCTGAAGAPLFKSAPAEPKMRHAVAAAGADAPAAGTREPRRAITMCSFLTPAASSSPAAAPARSRVGRAGRAGRGDAR